MKLLYDNFEIEKVGEFSGDEGMTLVEPISNDGVCDDTYDHVFWTVYGHKPDLGMIALVDRDCEEDALEIYNFLMILLEFFKKYSRKV